jgi:hypothetical protein
MRPHEVKKLQALHFMLTSGESHKSSMIAPSSLFINAHA